MSGTTMRLRAGVRKFWVLVLFAAVTLATACGGRPTPVVSTSQTTGSSGGDSSFAPPGVGSGSSSGSGSSTASNVQPITVDSGVNQNYANGVFTSVTVCVPNTTNCQTIDNVLVDTGSYGLRLLSSALPASFDLPMESFNTGSAAECALFGSGYTYGSVRLADIQISGEKASSVPVQMIGDLGTSSLPASCQSALSSLGLDPTANSMNTLSGLGSNGILGVGVWQQDCGDACILVAEGNMPLYYACYSATSCTDSPASLAQQVTNPVAMFASDNDGVIINLPSVGASGAVSVSGTMIFGIGTQSNNTLGSATVLPLDDYGNFTTTYQNQSYSGFVDSGSNALFFLDATLAQIPVCSDNATWYCPPNAVNLNATNTGAAGTASTTVSFNVADADTLFSSPNFAFSNLGGPGPSNDTFDWGLPFFFGRQVFYGIEGQTVPGVNGPTGPFVAY